jgi:electron transfer flavoprotein beta subunit
MKILVPVKRVIDPYVKIRVKPDGSGVIKDQVKMSMNPFDEIALEQALRCREAGLATEVVVVSLGESSCQEVLRHGLALGADRARLIQTSERLTSLMVAKVLQVVVQEEGCQLVLMGKQSIDGDNNQTPPMLASLLHWPQATNISKLTLEAHQLQVEREVDEGIELLQLPLPAVISVDLRLNTPRYATLPNIMKAKQKPLTITEWPERFLHLVPGTQVLEVVSPQPKKAGRMLSSVDELLHCLRNEAKII